ncbi:hypothetical protein [Luteolibacter sp. Populi]|uniref:hypothetical protein n=1 Tax=Luteolibacter sp. Populi TaxID=3230487 RepID=UPI003466EA7F
MKDEGIEALLGRLQPAAPDDALMARLRAARPQPKRSRRVIYLWAPLAAAAVLAIALIPRDQPASIAPDMAKVEEPQPVTSLQHLMDVADLGIVEDENNMPVRLIRTRWINEVVYASADGGEPVKEGRLREEVLPVSLPIY